MAYTTLNSLLTAIANAIRAKKGTTAQINAQNFPDEIASISTSLDSILIATSNSNSIIMGQSGGELGKETSVTFEPSNISAIITCGASLNEYGSTAGLNEHWPQPKVYATKEGETSEVECTWNDARKCYEVPDSNAKYTKVRAYVYGSSGSKLVYIIVGCLYVFGK